LIADYDRLKTSTTMSVTEIINELPNLSIEELKIIAKALRETAEDCGYLPEADSLTAHFKSVTVSHP
jgi:hypothetical protein